MIGRVVSAKMKNTVTVLVERMAMHPLYKKTFVQTKKYLVDASSGIKEGDVVEIIKVRPISKNKHWKVVKVVGQNLAEIVEAKQKEAAEQAVAEVMPESSESVDQSIGGPESGKQVSDTPTNQPTETPKLKKKKETK